MIRRGFLAVALVVAGSAASALAQTFTPQSSSGLSVTYSTEKTGAARVMLFGDVRNATNSVAERVVILAEGLDESGRVVTRGRCFVSGTVPSRGSSPFEIRMSATGNEKRFRVQVESFQFIQNN